MQLGLEVHAVRGEIVESRHHLAAALCDLGGRLRAGSEDALLFTTLRSAAKPFQLLPLVERGHAERLGLGDEELAVMASSHTGSPYHLRLVAGILERLGVDERRLVCGFHEPLDPVSRAEVRARRAGRSALHNNCSGKHAGMLALARAEGWPLDGYERPEHPVQELLRRTVAEVCGCTSDAVAVATDDCGVCVFGLELAAMARGYARLAAASPDGDGRDRALHAIRAAMTAHPVAAGGAERFSTRLMQATGGRVVSKGGAEGLECVGIAGAAVGLAVKCADGQSRAVGPAVVELLGRLELLSAAERERLADERTPLIRNHAGRPVGRLEPVVKVLSPAL